MIINIVRLDGQTGGRWTRQGTSLWTTPATSPSPSRSPSIRLPSPRTLLSDQDLLGFFFEQINVCVDEDIPFIPC